jgi:hypothetical protein
VLRLFERVVRSGKHLAVMGHHSHWIELSTPVAQEAIRRIRETGAQYRTQSPVLSNINDSIDVWARMWRLQVKLGCVPYYMFVERDTGSALPGKIRIDGVAEVMGETVFVLTFLQARNPDWVKRPFFAEFDPTATWLDHLQPAFGEEKFFYEDELRTILDRRRSPDFKWSGPGSSLDPDYLESAFPQ